MKKLIYTLVLSCIFCFTGFSQKQTVGILLFNYVESAADYQTVVAIQESVSNGFVKTKRFNIVDRAKMDALKSEKDLQSTEDFMDGSVVAQSKNLGAEFLISGMVTNAKADRMTSTSEDGTVTVTYKAKLVIQLKVLDVETGQVVTSETIEPKSGSSFGGMMGIGASTPEKAISKAMKDIEGDIDEFVAKNFPITASIVEASAKTIMIAVGSNNGVQKKDTYKVVEISEIEVDGKKMVRKKEIGLIVVSSVEDENFSNCTIKKGGSLIMERKEAGAELKCISITK
jgi:hypothetical protein